MYLCVSVCGCACVCVDVGFFLASRADNITEEHTAEASGCIRYYQFYAMEAIGRIKIISILAY